MTTTATQQAAPQTNLDALRAPAESRLPTVTPGFGSLQAFELMQRQAKLLSATDLVPEQYRGVIEKRDRYGNVTDSRENPKAIANCTVALNMALRMRADPLMIMQNLHVIEGRPSWSAAFIIAMINDCGRFSPLRFEFRDLGEKTVEYVSFEWKTGQDGRRSRETVTQKVRIRDRGCVAWVIELATGERLESDEITLEMAIREGWYTKNGSKWQTMPGQMLRYRSGSFFGRIYAPELLMGLPSDEEVRDTLEARTEPDGTISVDVETLRRENAERAQAERGVAVPKDDGVTDLQPKDAAQADGAAAAQPVDEEAAPVQSAPAAAADDAAGDSDDAQQSRQAASSRPARGVNVEQLEARMRAAKDIDVLDADADLIREIADPAEQDRMEAIYRELRQTLAEPPAQPAQAAARPQRRRMPAPE
ncbi:hypothetical protein [Achromobacter aloeverae]